MRSRKIESQKGILTIDFMFSFAMVIGLFQVFYLISYTLMVAQVSQYIAFASSRLYFAGHIDESSQQRLAEQKFKDLKENSSVSSFYRSAFVLNNFQAGEFNYPVGDAFRQSFVGVRIDYESKILNFNVPFLGRTDTELEGQGFKATVGSYLYREPTSEECFSFNSDRARAILRLNPKFNQAVSHGFDKEAMGLYADNGC